MGLGLQLGKRIQPFMLDQILLLLKAGMNQDWQIWNFSSPLNPRLDIPG